MPHGNSLTVLVYQHANADTIQVETVEEILNAVLDVCWNICRITFHLEDSQSHCLHN